MKPRGNFQSLFSFRATGEISEFPKEINEKTRVLNKEIRERRKSVQERGIAAFEKLFDFVMPLFDG